jgi:hypothetical protein
MSWVATIPIELDDRCKAALDTLSQHPIQTVTRNADYGPGRLVRLGLATGEPVGEIYGRPTREWRYSITDAGRQWIENCREVELVGADQP